MCVGGLDLDEPFLDSMRSVRDNDLGSRIGRLLTDTYYRL